MIAAVAPALTALRLSLHVLAAAVWVGGQVTLAGLVPTVRRLGPAATKQVARAFGRLSWPAYGVLVATGVWNVAASGSGQPALWWTVLGAKLAAVALAGLAALFHARAGGRRALAAWGALSALGSLAALVLGVLLAG